MYWTRHFWQLHFFWRHIVGPEKSLEPLCWIETTVWLRCCSNVLLLLIEFGTPQECLISLCEVEMAWLGSLEPDFNYSGKSGIGGRLQWGAWLMIQNEWLRVQLTAIDSMSLAYWCGVEWLSIYYWFFAIFATWLTDEIQQLEIINPPNGSSVYHIRIYGLLKEMAGNSRWTGDIFCF